ncbi:alpha/beta fold hydrolase [Krasilnikoviella flava]|uniref:Pimeloyl-ACP methyl ester carboxylesterase n=1 Tax=Krasilnikoviella flava TaxID=526729 RepID=A0A1T5JAV7_9MICO|nr:alpha/beta hydrolase [Krasilnikoviella flava]SKC48580.1 Pimeloyl-ACP methyl ester carboxylesterase [Krasilnikoviella flava]
MTARTARAGPVGPVPVPAATVPAPVPVVLVHGSRTSATMWRRQVAALGRGGVPATAVDLPGHGGRREEPFTLDGAVEAVRRAVDGAGGRALVVGLSLGGYVAIEHRARYPGQSAGLVAASCCTTSSSWLRPAWLSLARWIEAWPDHGARLNDTFVRLALDAEGVRDIGAGGFALRAMTQVLRELGPTDTLGALMTARSPVWIVNGRYDHFRAQERAFMAAARAGGAPTRLVVVPHARHLVSLDAPVAFTRVLLEAVAATAWSERDRAVEYASA